jgi:N-methylhydantoinase A/oxoprolinase/acetone carboxylase beta subunit
MAAAIARSRPVETILSGPAASVVGAAHLSGLADAVVADVGGTTTDVAILDGGRPRLAVQGALVGGHRTMVEAIDMSTTGLGGDSEVACAADGTPTLGPRRLIPLSLLAHHHPSMVAVLEATLGRHVPRATDGRLALRLAAGRGPHGRSRSQERLLALLASGPVPLETVVDREHLAIPLRSLSAEGLVAVAGFTPSDAAHVLGLQTGWSVEAAVLGAQLEARKAGQRVSPADFAATVMAAVRAASAHAVVAAAWRASGGLADALAAIGADPIFRRAIEGGPKDGPLKLGLALDRPVVALGGPAEVFYAGVPERLGSRLVLPPHHRVGNAVGAVVGEVVRHVERVATRVSDERLALYLEGRVVELPDATAAGRMLEEDARAAALAAARAAGAQDPVVTVVREEDRATLEGGAPLIVEIRVRATARGRPRQAAT